jgi:hypothetical protein
MEKQTVSKQRVADHGEVFTSPREVNAMLDLVKQETERIDSRFLEPACGKGNFLTEILNRKLRVVEKNYRRSQLEFEKYMVMAVSSLYGIDILEDNVHLCRQRLFQFADERYTALYKRKVKEIVRCVVWYILETNIIHGNALTLKTEETLPQSIVFAEWSFFGNKVTRRDFIFEELLPPELDKRRQKGLFEQNIEVSDQGKEEFLPKEKCSYPPVHFLKIGEENG